MAGAAFHSHVHVPSAPASSDQSHSRAEQSPCRPLWPSGKDFQLFGNVEKRFWNLRNQQSDTRIHRSWSPTVQYCFRVIALLLGRKNGERDDSDRSMMGVRLSWFCVCIQCLFLLTPGITAPWFFVHFAFLPTCSPQNDDDGDEWWWCYVDSACTRRGFFGKHGLGGWVRGGSNNVLAHLSTQLMLRWRCTNTQRILW